MKDGKDLGADAAAVDTAGSIAPDAAPHVGHTPGPWRTSRSDMATLVDGHESKWIYADHGEPGMSMSHVAVAIGIDSPWEEVVANAHLIAAAPEMKSALLGVLRRCDDMPEIAELLGEPEIAAIRAAIAKAEGRE